MILPGGANEPDDFSKKHSDQMPTLATVIEDYFIRIYKLQSGNKTATAKILGIGLATCFRYIRRYEEKHGIIFPDRKYARPKSVRPSRHNKPYKFK